MGDYPVHYERSRTGWVMALVVGLVVESCCLALFLVLWMAEREMPISLIWHNPGGSTPPAANQTLGTPGSIIPSSEVVDLPSITPDNTRPVETQLPAGATFTEPPSLPIFESPPPGKIVYVCFDGRFDQICLMNADGTNKRQLTFEDATDFYPSLSPDGQRIVFSSRRDGNFEVYGMDIKGDNLVKLTNDLGGNLYAPEISPKGNRIIFTHESGGFQSIWVMKIDGLNPHPMFESSGKDIDPIWSPDAMKVAYATGVTGSTQLAVVNVDGSKPHLLMPNGPETGGRSSWSPDGQWLAFYAGQRGNRNLYVVGVDGQNMNQLTNGGDNLGPSISPDGKWIAFTSYRDGNNEIYVINLNTFQEYRLTTSPNSDWQPRWGP